MTYDADKGGDQQLNNAACIPEDEALTPSEDCITVRVPGSGLDQTKRSTPASGTPVDAGDVVTYTLRFTNTGPAPATVDAFDDVSGVVDDATLGTISAEAGLNAVLDPNGGQPRIHVTGTVPAGETLTVTYSATVNDAGSRGDDVLRNSLACPAGAPAGCEPETTEHPVRSLELTKTSDATADSRPGDTVTYTVTADNTSDGAFTEDDPVVVIDDLTGVLDDADFQNDASATIGGVDAGDPTYVEPRLRWEGALAAGETVTITYTVVLNGGGDGEVDNVAWAPTPGDPPGPTPDCDARATNLPCAEESYDLPKLSITKAADPVEVNATGDVVTYTVVVTNEGPGDYTAPHRLPSTTTSPTCSTTPRSWSARRPPTSARRPSPRRSCVDRRTPGRGRRDDHLPGALHRRRGPVDGQRRLRAEDRGARPGRGL